MSKTGSMAMDAMQKQSEEFDAFQTLQKRASALFNTAVVDDDYPRVRHEYEGALANFITAMKCNDRFEQGNRYGLKPV
jgi:hypothetical protein